MRNHRTSIFLTGALLALLIVIAPQSFAQEAESFSIEDCKWLAGHWKGDGFDGISEEVWTEPVDATMMGMYRHYKDGKIVFYEFIILDREGMKLKHFHPDLTGWETKEKYITFETVAVTEGKLEFKGLTFEKKSDTEMEIRLKLNRGGEISTEVFTMHRVE